MPKPYRKPCAVVALVVLLSLTACSRGPVRTATPGLDDQSFAELLTAVAAAWNANDASAAAALFTEDAIYTEPPDRQVYVGRAELFRFFGGESGREAGMHMRWHHLSFNADTQTGAGEFTFSWAGGQVHGMTSVQVRDGRIARWREYFYESPLRWEDFQGVNRF